ncbi:imidazole glycerol phosphate synthase subunit HisH [Dethiothermospora halolimnae]|uniref:imidazole glycerol phosphate synthase subunit HisH n=1 Tax=Dethiothermospora halolimnae TaxID=3114390 RepID=UPI003CCC464A
MITIIDYGSGNLKSIKKALDYLKIDSIISNKVYDIDIAHGIILPGVGAFNDAMENLKQSKLIPTIIDNVNKGKPILGICLGMQLLYEKSFENGETQGLELLKGQVVKFKEDLIVPHMGWNKLNIKKKSKIDNYIKEDYVYFIHSYYVKSDGDEIIATTKYGKEVPAIVGKENLFGMQFHPEKSGEAGLSLLRGFGELVK